MSIKKRYELTCDKIEDWFNTLSSKSQATVSTLFILFGVIIGAILVKIVGYMCYVMSLIPDAVQYFIVLVIMFVGIWIFFYKLFKWLKEYEDDDNDEY